MTHTDQVIDMAWSDIQVGYFVRWATPRFVKYGRILTIGGNSMSVQFIEDKNPRGIPDAKWYFVQGKLDPHSEEHLVVIDYKQWYSGDEPKPDRSKLHRRTHVTWISVSAACEMINMDQKRVRRYIRRGIIPARKQDDRWLVNAETLRELAAKNGWI